MSDTISEFVSQSRQLPEPSNTTYSIEYSRYACSALIRFFWYERVEAQLRLYYSAEGHLRATYRYPGHWCKNYLHPEYFFQLQYDTSYAQSFLLKTVLDISGLWPASNLVSICRSLCVPGEIYVNNQRELARHIYGSHPERAPVQRYEIHAPAF